MKNVFHNGEIAVQEIAGQRQMATMVGRGIHPNIPYSATHFIEQQPMTVVGSTDEKGQLWASLLTGEVGFIEVLSGESLSFHKALIRSTQQDIFFENIQHNESIGALFIEMATRRRYRVNGTVSETDTQISINSEEAYGNCPKYIQRHNFTLPEKYETVEPKVTTGNALTASEKDWIAQAHTFFVVSKSLNGKTDASHRGGNTGFVEVLENGVLKIPDYSGNNMFNTLGNIYENPIAGLLFIDVEKGTTLQLTGKAWLDFDENTDKNARFWKFETTQWIKIVHHHQAKWEFVDFSPFNP